MPGTYLMMAVLRDTWTVHEGTVEQTFGYAPTFGLVAVDRQTFETHPKPSASWLGSVSKTRRLP